MKLIRTLETILIVIASLINIAMAGNDANMKVVDEWLKTKNLNEYGDEQGMMYMGGTPLFNEMTGERKDRLEYLIQKFPNKPWEQMTGDK